MAFDVQEQRYSEQVRKVFGAKGTYGLHVLDDVQPSWDINEAELPEMWILRGERRYVLAQGLAAPGAGNVNRTYYSNTSTDMLVVIEYIENLGPDLSIVASIQAGAHGTGLGIQPYDSRAPAVSAVRFLSNVFAGAGIANWTMRLVGPKNLGIVLLPGWELVVVSGAQNTANAWEVSWRERRASPEELATK